ncbi:MAG: alpha/beta-type small acid-soluble spore protein [Peptococcaceae bacterium]|nr:alpha/beta-type small acid-soluble spore protein [Peptococcaceae bacterium]
MGRETNVKIVPGAKQALDRMKYEVANELGLGNYQQIDKGDLPSRVNGKVGGNMVRKMIAFAENALMQGQQGQVTQSAPPEPFGTQGQ